MLNSLFKSTVKRFARDESGATAVEYGTLLAILSLAIIGSGNTIWVMIKDKFLFLATTVTTG